MRDEDDATLVRLARAGEKEAFAALLGRHRPLLVALCRRALDGPEAVEDVVQEAILQAMLNLDRLRQADRFGPWLAGIGLNLARRSRRGSRADWSWEAVVGGRAGPEPADPGAGPAELAEAADLAARVREAVAGLPPGQRAAVLTVYLGGMTQAEAAALLGIDVGAVKTRLHKARARLRRTLWETWREVGMETGTTVGNGAGAAVDVRVADVRRHAGTDGEPHLVIILQETAGERRLPIWVGEFEGTAIALHLEGIESPRPQTYAFAAKLVAAAGGTLREVRIDRLEGDVFYAVVAVDGPRGATEIDARPSDALNLALLAGAPIRISRRVLDMADQSTEKVPMRTAALDAPAIEGAAQIAAAAVAAWERHATPPPPPPAV